MHWLDQVERDYGVPMTVRGAILFAKQTDPASANFSTVNQYIRACRRLAQRRGFEITCDYRLIGAGWNVVKPSDWISRFSGVPTQLDDLCVYWNNCSRRPNIVGSCWNKIDPDGAFWAMRAKIPAHIALLLGWRVLPREGSKTRPYCSRKRLRILRDAARAMARRSARNNWIVDRLTTRALAVLGRLSAGMQSSILAHIQHWPDRMLHVRDLPFEAMRETRRVLSDRSPVEILDRLIVDFPPSNGCVTHSLCVQ